MQRVDYDDRQHQVYRAGRRQLAATAELWRRRIAACAGEPPPQSWLDLGSGTGRFSTLLADLFDASVVGVEPSAGMRTEAQWHARHPNVRYLEGRGEAIPATNASVDAVMMSMVFHHLTDPRAVALEVRRVLRPGGRVLIRTGTRDSHLESTFYRFFEGARRIDQLRLPSLAELRSFGDHCGLVSVHHEVVRQQTDESLTAFQERMQLRPFSTFELMTEAEIEEGFGRLASALERGDQSPIVEHVDLVVLEARPQSSHV